MILHVPAPAGGRAATVVRPLGADDFDADEERRIRRAEACERYRDKNRELVNARVQAWRDRKKRKAA